jgi:hypothetical protein
LIRLLDPHLIEEVVARDPAWLGVRQGVPGMHPAAPVMSAKLRPPLEPAQRAAGIRPPRGLYDLRHIRAARRHSSLRRLAVHGLEHRDDRPLLGYLAHTTAVSTPSPSSTHLHTNAPWTLRGHRPGSRRSRSKQWNAAIALCLWIVSAHWSLRFREACESTALNQDPLCRPIRLPANHGDGFEDPESHPTN